MCRGARGFDDSHLAHSDHFACVGPAAGAVFSESIVTRNIRDTGNASSKTALAYFDGHAAYYEKSQYRTARRTFVNARHDQIVSLLSRLPVPASARVLDAGCGPGNLVPEFASRYRQVCAMDASPRMLHIARANGAGLGNVAYQVGSIEDLPYGDGSFDLVCSAGVIEYLQHWDTALSELHRVLRPGAVLILPTTNALAPAHWLRPVLEPIARTRLVARLFGMQPATFQLWHHRVSDFKRRLQTSGFEIEVERHFYLTLPRPLDRVFPAAAQRVESFFDRYMEASVRHLAEGYIAVARKSGISPSPIVAESVTAG